MRFREQLLLFTITTIISLLSCFVQIPTYASTFSTQPTSQFTSQSISQLTSDELLTDLVKVSPSAIQQLGQNFIRAEQLCFIESLGAKPNCFFNEFGSTYVSPRGGVYLLDSAHLRMAYAGVVNSLEKSKLGFYFDASDIFSASRRFLLKEHGLEYTLAFEDFFKQASVYQDWFQKLVKTSEFQTFWNMKESDHAIYAEIIEKVETILLLQDASEDDFVVVGEPIYMTRLIGASAEEFQKLKAEGFLNGTEEFLEKSPTDNMGVYFWSVVRIKNLPKLDRIPYAHRLFLSVQYIGDEQHLQKFKETHKTK